MVTVRVLIERNTQSKTAVVHTTGTSGRQAQWKHTHSMTDVSSY